MVCLYESADWPIWWKGVLRVTVIKENDANGINGIREYDRHFKLNHDVIMKWGAQGLAKKLDVK